MKTPLLPALPGAAARAFPQALSVKGEDLMAADVRQAVQEDQTTGMPPFGIVRTHSPHLPPGADPIDVRNVPERAARQGFAQAACTRRSPRGRINQPGKRRPPPLECGLIVPMPIGITSRK